MSKIRLKQQARDRRGFADADYNLRLYEHVRDRVPPPKPEPKTRIRSLAELGAAWKRCQRDSDDNR